MPAEQLYDDFETELGKEAEKYIPADAEQVRKEMQAMMRQKLDGMGLELRIRFSKLNLNIRNVSCRDI